MSKNIKRAERPDQALFFVMMGVCFLFFAVASANLAYYSFGEYRHKTAFVGELQASSEQFMAPYKRKELKDRIDSNASLASRHLLELILSGAGALVLFGITLLFFRNALRACKVKTYYENIDWNVIPLPTHRVEVHYKQIYDILFALIILFFVGMLMLIFKGQGLKLTTAIISFLITLTLLLLSYLHIRAKRRAVRLFDASGITRGDGRQFSWNEFCGVVTRIDINYAREQYAWRVEFAFANGEAAWIIPHRIKNAEEVFKFIAALPGAFLKDS